jgi:hypothetical protein
MIPLYNFFMEETMQKVSEIVPWEYSAM